MEVQVHEETHLAYASWFSLDSGKVSFTKNWEKRSLPKLFWSEDRLELKTLRRAKPDDYGLISGYFSRKDAIVFVIRVEHLQDIAWEENGIFVAGAFNGWKEAIGDKSWEMKPERINGKKCLTIAVPRKDIPVHEVSYFKFVSGKEDWIEVPPDAPNGILDQDGARNYIFDPHRTGRHLFFFETPVPLTDKSNRDIYFLQNGKVESVHPRPGVFLKKIETDEWLGNRVDNGKTIFRIFAPRARSVKLLYAKNPEFKQYQEAELSLNEKYIWELELDEDLHGQFYYYQIAGAEVDGLSYFDEDFKVLDPYAKGAVGPMGPGVILNDSTFEANRPDTFKPPSWHDLVIAEAHVRDLTRYAPIKLNKEERLGYSGLSKWVKSPQFYLSELGVNAVELQPIHLFDTRDKEEYGWGYMPVNYFSPASQYASKPDGVAAVEEFQDLVSAFHDRDMAVILDVVYNHYGEPNYLQFIDKEYYFLLDEEGHYYNYSGCGNTIDSEPPMVRHLMRDSLVHFMENFGIDGFRFDLGELIGKESLAWLERELKAVNPNVILIAEPWSFRAHIMKDLKETGFASWNDAYRESIKDYVLGKKGADGLAFFMKGSTPDYTRFPAQTINYVESHDDRCWIDKITENSNYNGSHPTSKDRRRTHLMAAILMMSTGVPMVNSGMDMMKSKNGVNNTYLDGELNAIPYGRAFEYSGTVQYFRSWIKLRLSSLGKLLRLDGFPSDSYYKTDNFGAALGILYNADYSKGDTRLFFAVNPTDQNVEFKIEGFSLTDALLIADTERVNENGLGTPRLLLGKDKFEMPAVSCGLWKV